MESNHKNKDQDPILDRLHGRPDAVFGRVTDRDRRRPYPWYWVETGEGELFIKERRHPDASEEIDLRVNGVKFVGYTVRDDNDIRGITDRYSIRIQHGNSRESGGVLISIYDGHNPRE